MEGPPLNFVHYNKETETLIEPITRFDEDISFNGNITFNGSVTYDNCANNLSDEWFINGNNYENTQSMSTHPISSSNIIDVDITNVPISGSSLTNINSYGNPTSDGINIYLCTQGGTIEAGGSLPSGSTSDGMIMCINIDTKCVIWKRKISEYSGLKGDNSRSSPTIHGNNLYFGSSLAIPQTLSPYTDVVNRFSGTPAETSGRPARLYCVDKTTGNLNWETEVTERITSVTQDSNWSFISTAPVVLDIDLHGDGIKRSIVICGTTSSQSFKPWLLVPNGGGPFGIPIGQRPDFRFTDYGRIIVCDAQSGELLASRNMTKKYKVGDIVAASELFIGAQTYVEIYHHVIPADIAPGGILNDAVPDFTSKIMWLLSGTSVAPAMIQGKTFRDKTGLLSVIPTSPSLAGANFDQVAIEIEGTFKPSTNQFNYDTVDYDITLATQLLDGTGTLRQARIIKRLFDADVMTEEDAHECSWFGASVWSPQFAVKKDQNDNPIEIYITCGQNHKIPYFESKLFDDPVNNWIPQSQAIKAAQDVYLATPNQTNFDALQAIYSQIESDLTSKLLVQRSASGNLNYADSCVCLKLNDLGVFGIKWIYRGMAFDTWHQGFQLDAQRQSAYGAVFIPGIANIQTFYGHQLGQDADMSSGSIYDKTNDRVILTSKGGYAWVLNVSGSSPVLNFRTRLGNAGVLGGTNYGSSFDGRYLYTILINVVHLGNINADPAPTGILQPAFASSMDWYLPDKTRFQTENSFRVKYDTYTGQIVWSKLLTPETAGIVSASFVRSIDDIVYFSDGAGNLRCVRKSDGQEIFKIIFPKAGQTGIMATKNSLWIIPSRSSFETIYPNGTKFGSGKYLYEIKL